MDKTPLAAEQAIVAAIEAKGRRLVDANRQLIDLFERKIQATLARVLGVRTSRPWVKRGYQWRSMASGTARAQP